MKILRLNSPQIHKTPSMLPVQYFIFYAERHAIKSSFCATDEQTEDMRLSSHQTPDRCHRHVRRLNSSPRGFLNLHTSGNSQGSTWTLPSSLSTVLSVHCDLIRLRFDEMHMLKRSRSLCRIRCIYIVKSLTVIIWSV